MRTIENNVFVIWPWAKKQKKIVRYIRRNFFLLDEFEGRTTLKDFYGLDHLAIPVTARVFVVRTMYARLPRWTSTGRRPVNPFMFDAKQTLRKWGGRQGLLNSVHGSDDQAEAMDNLAKLVPRHESLKTSAQALLLRAGDDLDILVSDLEQFVKDTGAIRIDAYGVIDVDEVNVKYKYLAHLYGKQLTLDIREPGDGYMDERWQRDILASRDYGQYAQLYHDLIHKGRPGDMSELLAYMDEHGYEITRPNDFWFVQFNSLIGTVVDGHGTASTAPQPGLPERWAEGCGYEPYPGTLNIRYDGRFQLPKPHHMSQIRVYYPDLEKHEDKALYFWSARINGEPCTLTVGGNRLDEVEVLAPTNLRDKLGLETGDTVKVVIVDGYKT